ncbi:MAG: LPP20 family lipoprotein [Treponema sp.]|jgi:hypothetical protein|nr:LPP20 family lipoprotein [Treponema sp.]
MFKITGVFLSAVLIFSFFSCGSTPAPAPAPAPVESSAEDKAQADAEATAAAMDALARMQNGGVPPAASPSGGSQQPPQAAPAAAQPTPAPARPAPSQPAAQTANPNRGEPVWVASPESTYPRNGYVAATGFGDNRAGAEKNALAALISIFGQSIQAELKVLSDYRESIANGRTDVRQSETVSSAIKTFSSLDSLLGAEVRDTWFDSAKGTYYAVAVMEKAKTITLYADTIRSNQRIINDLINIAAAERNSLEAYSRYQFAARIADANRVYANILSYVGDTTSGINPATMKKGDDYRLEALNITRNIPIGVNVTNDSQSRISGAFRGILTDVGFRSGGNTSRYILRINVSLEPVNLPGQANKFSRCVIDANLMDMNDDTILLPWNFNLRSGHLNQSEADNRAIRDAEAKIKAEYGSILKDYLSSVLPSY